MRIIWKDSISKDKKELKYRGYRLIGYGNGWIIDVPNDSYIYRTNYCAQNAIDKYLDGEFGIRGSEKRKSYGISIIGRI